MIIFPKIKKNKKDQFFQNYNIKTFFHYCLENINNGLHFWERKKKKRNILYSM